MSSKDPETWMWERARAMLEQADRVQRKFFRPGTRRPSWEPPVDVFETATELCLLVALPGVEPDRIHVELQDVTITVFGERTVPPGLRSAAIHRLEIPHGLFERRVELPPGSYELSRRELVDGCLILILRILD